MSTPTTIEEWLARVDLSRLAATFRDNGIDLDVVARLGDDDLRELGLTIGDRKRVLAAVSSFAAVLPPTAAVERRQLTVMFCDLADSTALSSRLDPEDMRDVIRAYQTACADVIARHDGFVAKFMGDGLLAYFGYPRAHEDEAERAVRAGLEIVASVGGLQTPAREALQVRIGIATGLVVVGDLIGAGAAEEQSVVGETPNLAARLQGLARPNAVLIAEATRRQVGNLFEFIDLGPQAMKGLATPQPVWRVLGESDAANRFKALRSSATPLVGREAEIAVLMRGWTSGKTGRGHAVLISADPGLGKSRLAEAVRERIAGEPHVTVRYFCSPHHRESAFYPIARQLERAAGFDCNDDAQARRRKLEAMLAGGPAEAELSLFADLLSVPGLEARWVQELTPESRKERMLDALVQLFEDLTRRRPVLAMFEDLALDGSQLGRAAGSCHRAPRPNAGLADRDLPARIPARLDRTGRASRRWSCRGSADATPRHWCAPSPGPLRWSPTRWTRSSNAPTACRSFSKRSPRPCSRPAARRGAPPRSRAAQRAAPGSRCPSACRRR